MQIDKKMFHNGLVATESTDKEIFVCPFEPAGFSDVFTEAIKKFICLQVYLSYSVLTLQKSKSSKN